VEIGSDGARWPTEEISDLSERQVLVEPKDDDRSLTGWQAAEFSPGLVDLR
jgi:hypothetical protein